MATPGGVTRARSVPETVREADVVLSLTGARYAVEVAARPNLGLPQATLAEAGQRLYPQVTGVLA